MSDVFQHQSVLLEQAINGLNICPDGIYVDCTVGGAGHSEQIAHRLSRDGRLIGIDQDEEALAAARDRLRHARCHLDLVKRNFRDLSSVLDELHIAEVDGFLFDIGVSSHQLDRERRGFSYHQEAPLDMRMDMENPLTAYDVVNGWAPEDMVRALRQYGEERFSKRIVREIVCERENKPIETTTELADIVKNAIPAPARRRGPHPARRTFQALRIVVNDELKALEEGLEAAIRRTARGGRICVITFHSLEDRIVKGIFRKASQGCTCPPDFPVCRCGNDRLLNIVNRKPIVPTEDEVATNPRARSAKLRIVEKVKEERRD